MKSIKHLKNFYEPWNSKTTESLPENLCIKSFLEFLMKRRFVITSENKAEQKKNKHFYSKLRRLHPASKIWNLSAANLYESDQRGKQLKSVPSFLF